MSASTPPRTKAPRLRIEYLGFSNVEDAREYRLMVHAPEAAFEFKFTITLGAFAAGQVRLQDGPDICYQKLAQEIADGDKVTGAVRVIGADELLQYKDAHTVLPRRTMAVAAATSPAPAAASPGRGTP